MRTEPQDVLDAVIRGWPFARPSWLGGARYDRHDEWELAETVIEVQDCDLMIDDEPTLVDDRIPFIPPAPPAIWSPCA
jgi:hypothetical protein